MTKLRYAALLATTLLLLSACSSGDTPNETPSASTETPSTSTETPSTSTETPSTSTDGSPSNYIQIAAGGSHTCAVLTTGGVRCWGYNFNGHLGESTPPDWKPTSEDVVGLSSKVVSIAAGDLHTCAVLDTGGVQCWGHNLDGQLGGFSSTITTNTPVTVVGLSSKVVSIAAGREHTCALLGTGGVQCWGDSTLNDSGPPRDVEGLSSKAVSIAAVWQHTCALLDTGGVQCWGWNNTGQLGNGTEIASDTPVDVVGLSSKVVSIAAGTLSTCALLDTGGVQCWGYNLGGGLGNGTEIASGTPVDVVGLSAKVVSIAVGDAVCALLDTGGVQCWGDNEDGQLGNGNVTNSSTPVDVVGLSAKVVSIAAGGYHMCALLDTGGVQCWGYNLDGQLGNGNVANSSTPVDVTEHR